MSDPGNPELTSPDESTSLALRLYQQDLAETLIFHSQFLHGIELSLENRTALNRTIKDKVVLDIMAKAYTHFDFKTFIEQLVFCHTVDRFEKYLKDLLTELYVLHPSTVAGEARLSVAEVRKFGSLEDLVEHIGVLHINRLAERGLKYLIGEFERIGVNMRLDKDTKRKLFKSFELRNRIVHKHTLALSIKQIELHILRQRREFHDIKRIYSSFTDAIRFFYSLPIYFELRVKTKFSLRALRAASPEGVAADLIQGSE